ncbi:MAG: hypothetical protein LUF92_15605 [Clostridiales bacterium]|nr:hypothetical protein [Clostridiales bacterium]
MDAAVLVAAAGDNMSGDDTYERKAGMMVPVFVYVKKSHNSFSDLIIATIE